MKKRFLPFSLLLVIMILGQSVMADQGGHYVPRAKENSSAAAFLNSMRVNQHTGLIDPAWMIAAEKQVAKAKTGSKYADIVYWKSMGPDNLGGKTTSIVYDIDNLNEVYIGSMGGGVFYTWNKGISWHQVGDENLLVSCMAQAENGTIYVGTGDCGTAATYNGLEDLTYENSFVGSGLYKINSKTNEMSRVNGTEPTTINGVSEWSFINDIAVVGNKVVVATSDGLKYSNDENTWAYAKVEDEDLVGSAMEVKVASDDMVVAAVDNKIYIGGFEGNELVMTCRSSSSSSDVSDSTGIVNIGTAAGLLDIAVAPSDPNVIYAAAINNKGNHNKIYISENKGQTWRIILPAVSNNNSGQQVYENKGLYSHGLTVNPSNSNVLYVLGYDIWRLDRPTSDTNGYYLAIKVSSVSNLHVGINDFAFDPRNPNSAYVATDGGIYKAQVVESYFNYVNCNRGYISTRCFNVAPSGKGTRVVGGTLDHGPVLIEGQEGTNNMGTADLLRPALTPAHYGAFDESYAAGFCAVSVVNPNAFIVTTKAGGIYRTESAGEDYDQSNFLHNDGESTDPYGIVSLSSTTGRLNYEGYRMPMALWETFNDENSVDSVWFKCKQNYEINDVIQCVSANGGYPFDYELPVSLHYDTLDPVHSDSILVKDPITSKLFLVAREGTGTNDAFAVYYTRDAIKFSVRTNWYVVANGITSLPTCISVSADGDVLFVGTVDGTLVRVSNLNAAVDAYTAEPDSVGFAPVATLIELPVSGQCVTSVGIFTDNPDKVVVTLGNYGNDSYVLYSNNALSDEPVFTAKQGNLPKMPVYSSVYTSTYDGSTEGHVLIGTEHGVYRTTNIGASSPVWTAESDNMGDVPVMELKQQLVKKDRVETTAIVDDELTTVYYPGTDNEGTIYAATYGRGLFRCETYHQSPASVPETPAGAVAKSNISMYPNPVSGDEAKVSFKLNTNATVSYQVFDIKGRMVKNEVIGSFTEGSHEASVSVNGLANGSYILRLNAGNYTSCVKFMVF